MQQVEAESDIGADETECVIHDRTPEGEVSHEGIGYIKLGDSNIITMDVKEKPPESITYKLPLSVEERGEGDHQMVVQVGRRSVFLTQLIELKLM